MIFAQRFVILCWNKNCRIHERIAAIIKPRIEWPQRIVLLIYHSAHVQLRTMWICRSNVYGMPQLIEYLEKRGAYNKTRREWRALEDHLEFITVRQCVNTRRENDKQHSAERCV